MASSTDQLVDSIKKLDKTTFDNPQDLYKTKRALLAAYRRLQEPIEVVFDQTFQEPATSAVVKTLIDLDFWKKWVDAGGKPSTSVELAKLVSIDRQLLKRFLRELASYYLLDEVDYDTYALTDFTRSLAQPLFPSLYHLLHMLNQPIYSNMPKFLADTGYKNPEDAKNTCVTHMLGGNETLFSYFSKQPEIASNFNEFMTLTSELKPHWVDIYPTETIVGAAKDGRALVVDMGGGVGHDTEKMRKKHPNVPKGSLILQDLPHVIAKTVVQEPAVAQAFDFNEPQHIKGARVYYLHSVLHDWADSTAIPLLKNIASVMEKGYSKILLHENVVHTRDPHPRTTMGDIVMLSHLSAMERDDSEWRQLAKASGLKVMKIWTLPTSIESIIELELA